MTKNLVFSKHRSAGTLVDFSLQCKFWHKDWRKVKVVLREAQELFCLRELIVDSGP